MLAIASTIAFWPGALDRWALPKIIVLGLAALLGVWVTPRGRLPRGLVLVGGIGILILLVATLMSALPLASLFGRWPRYEGLVSISGYGLALWLGARLLGSGANHLERNVARGAVAVASIVLGFVGFLAAVGVELLPSSLARSGALLGNATDQGAVGAAFAILLVAPILRGRMNWLTVLGIIFGIATVIESGSRAALLVLLLGLALVVVLDGIRNGWRRRVVVTAAIGVAAIVLLGLTVPTIASRVLGSSPLAAASVADRPLIWGDSWKVFLAHPVLGVGPSGFEDAVAGTHAAAWFSAVGETTTLDSPHNFVLQALVVGGPLLLLALVAAVVLTAIVLLKRYRSAGGDEFSFALGASVASIAIGGVLLTTVSSPATVLLASFLLGIAVAQPVQPKAPRSPDSRAMPVRRWAASVAIAAWIALCILTLAGETALSDGVSASAASEYSAASADFTRATALRPWDIDTPIIASEALTKRLDGGDTAAQSAALAWAKRAMTADPDSLPAAKSAITTYLDAHDLAPAAALTARFARLLPADPWIADRLGVIETLETRDAAAVKQLLLATKLDPTTSAPWLTLAYVYQREGNSSAAAAAQQKADSLDR